MEKNDPSEVKNLFFPLLWVKFQFIVHHMSVEK